MRVARALLSKLTASPPLRASPLLHETDHHLHLHQDIHHHLTNTNKTLESMSRYYFDGQGKNLRPRLSLAMARAVNSHLGVTSARVSDLQRRVASISEMIHTSSLLHDDVIDNAEIRRGKISVNRKVGFWLRQELKEFSQTALLKVFSQLHISELLA